MSTPKVEDIARQIQALSPADKLRLAAGLLEGRSPRRAYDIARRTVEELVAWLAMHPEVER